VIFVSDSRTPAGTRIRIDDLELAAESFGSGIPLIRATSHHCPIAGIATANFNVHDRRGRNLDRPVEPRRALSGCVK